MQAFHRRNQTDFSTRFAQKNSRINQYGTVVPNEGTPAQKGLKKSQIYPDSPFVSSANSLISGLSTPTSIATKKSFFSENSRSRPKADVPPVRQPAKAQRDRYLSIPVVHQAIVKKRPNQNALSRSLDYMPNSQLQVQYPNLSKHPRAYNDFKPYTIADYNRIKNQPIPRGGLGPANVGTQEWMQKKALHDKRMEYSKQISLPGASGNNVINKTIIY